MDESAVGTVSRMIVEVTEPTPTIDYAWVFTLRLKSRDGVSHVTFSFGSEADAEASRRAMLDVIGRAIAIH